MPDLLAPFTPNGVSFVDSIGDVLLAGMGLAVLIAWVYYTRFFGWHRSAAGRALWTFLLALLLVLAQNSVARFLGTDYLLRDWIRTVIYAGGFGATVFIIFSLRHYKKIDDETFKQLASRITADAFERKR